MLIRPYLMATPACPFDSLRVADIGDVAINTFNLQNSIAIIETAYDSIVAQHCIPLALRGDHTIVLPIPRAMHRQHGPVGLVHIDAHADVNDEMFGERITHGTPFRRAVEEGLIDCSRSVQIGLRATGYGSDDFDWPRAQGTRLVQAEELAFAPGFLFVRAGERACAVRGRWRPRLWLASWQRALRVLI